MVSHSHGAYILYAPADPEVQPRLKARCRSPCRLHLVCDTRHNIIVHTVSSFDTPTSSSDPVAPHHIIPNHSLDDNDDGEDDPRTLPSQKCLSDPTVQAGAARLQTIMTTTMGTLSALTTGWWGHFGERHGRTRVLAFSTLGLFLMFVDTHASTPCVYFGIFVRFYFDFIRFFRSDFAYFRLYFVYPFAFGRFSHSCIAT
jgi:hypothetical protein